MRFERFLWLIGLGCALAFSPGARAADVIPVNTGSPCHIRLVGEISSGDAKRIENAFSAAIDTRPIKINDPLKNSTVICLDSPGGSYVEALRIMDLLKDRGIGTVIERESRCYSACAFIFMAGQVQADEGMSYPWRQMHFAGRLGFHAPYFNLEKEMYPKEEVQRLIQGLTATTSWLLRNSQRSSIPVSLISEMLRYGPNELLEVDNVLLVGRWNLEPYGLSVPVIANEKSANYLCQNQYIWERYDDYTSAATAREYVEENRLSDLYTMPSGVSVKKVTNGMRVSIPGFPPEGTRICVVDFVMNKGRVVKVHQDWDYEYEEKRPAFPAGGEV